MTKVADNDKVLEYIAKQTKLPPERAALLMEEERDLCLVIEQIVKEPLSKKEIGELPFDLFIKLVIFRFTRETKFSLADKLYVSNAITKFIPKIRKKEPLVKKHGKAPPSEDIAGFCLVALGFAHEKITKDNEFLIEQAIEHFKETGQRNIALNIKEWVKILHEIKKNKTIEL